MMKRIFFLFFLLFFAATAQAKVKVVATLPVFASLAQEIGGDRVEVTSLARPNQDPHFLDAKPSYVVQLNRSDLLIQGGLDLEAGWLPPILTQAQNPKILPGNAGHVNAADGIHALEVPSVMMDRSWGDVHPQGNPHIWMDPRNGKLIAANIFRQLSRIDPEGKTYYEERLKAFLGRLNEKLASLSPLLGQVHGKKVITYHKSFSYFADWTGMNVVETIEPKPGIPPSTKHVDNLVKLIPQEQIRGIIAESFYPKKFPQYLAEKGKIPLLILPTQPSENESYTDLIERLVMEIQRTL